MKPHMSPHMAAALFVGAMSPLSAQNLERPSAAQETSKADAVYGLQDSAFKESSVFRDPYEVPEIARAQGLPPGGSPVYAAQDVRTLNTRVSGQLNVESVINLNVLRNPSPFRKIAVSSAPQPYEISADSLQAGLALISAVYRETGKQEDSSDCSGISLSVEQRIKLDVARTLEVVESEVASNPGCACEIVKSAIKASEADVQLVVSIVETAITVSPENMRMISQCAIATMPEAVAEIQALLARLDPNSGDSDVYSSKGSKSAKSSKDAKEALVAPASSNPLDIPHLTPLIPIIIVPKPVTNVNPGCRDR